MTTKQQNPLSAYFRTPKLYSTIPTKGRYYNNDILELPEGINELPIYAMTTKDELIQRNPEALLNGEAVVQVIQSCVPCVKNARKMLYVDIEVLLIAIRGATHGDEIPVTAQCPKCEERVDGVASVDAILSTMGDINDSYIIERDALRIKIKPFDYGSHVEAGRISFQTHKEIESLQEIEKDEDKMKAFDKTYGKMSALTFNLMINSIDSILIMNENGTEEIAIVADKDHIREFLDNSDQSIGKEINEKIEEINNGGVTLEMLFRCEADSCKGEGEGHEFTSRANVDPVNFSIAS